MVALMTRTLPIILSLLLAGPVMAQGQWGPPPGGLPEMNAGQGQPGGPPQGPPPGGQPGGLPGMQPPPPPGGQPGMQPPFPPGGEPPAKVDPKQLEAFEKARAKGEILFDMAQMYRQAGKLDEALAACRKVAELTLPVLPGHPESRMLNSKRLLIYTVMADIYRQKKDFDGAAKAIDEGQEKAAAATDLPDSDRLKLQIELLKAGAHIYQQQGKVDKAAEYYQRALALTEK